MSPVSQVSLGIFPAPEILFNVAEIPRQTGRMVVEFADTRKILRGGIRNLPHRGILRFLAKSTRSRPVSLVSLGISATPTILSAWQKSPARLTRCSSMSPGPERSSRMPNSKFVFPNDFSLFPKCTSGRSVSPVGPFSRTD